MDLTTVQIAALCQVSERTIARWIRDKKLNAQALPNGRYRVTEADLEAMRPPDTVQLTERVEALETELRGLYDALQSVIGRVETLEHKPASQPKVLRPAPPEYHVASDETMTARNFAEAHGLSRNRMETWIKHQAFATTITEYQGKPQHRLTPEQQRGVVTYWQENQVPFERCTVEACPCHEQK